MQDSACWWQFFLGIVNISDILSDNLQGIPLPMLFTLTEDSQFLSGFIFLFFFKHQMVVFYLKQKKKKNYNRHANGLQLQPIHLLKVVLCSSISSQIHFYCIEDNTLTIKHIPHFTDNQTRPSATFSWHLIFHANKYCGLLNIASWLTGNKFLWYKEV